MTAASQTGSRRAAKAAQPNPAMMWLKYLLIASFIAAAAFAGMLAVEQTEQLLVRDARFTVPAGEVRGEPSPNLKVEGVAHAPLDQIVRLFEKDYSRSLYLFPHQERRRQLLAVNWVKDATVSRVWPNHVHVRIKERLPVAFAQLPTGATAPDEPPSFEVALIDADGVLLAPPKSARFTLPVVTGLRREMPENDRRERIYHVLRMLKDTGELSKDFSEIDAGDPENLKVTRMAGGKAVVLVLGNRQFKARLEGFLSRQAEILRRLPKAHAFDLRIEDRITAMGDGSGSE